MGLILFIISVILTGSLFLVSVIMTPIYFFVSLKWISGLKALNKYFETLAVSVDQFGNGLTKELLNRTMIRKSSVNDPKIKLEGIEADYSRTENQSIDYNIKYMDFGDIDMTISYILGVNKGLNNLTLFGRIIVTILDILDKNHVEKALESQFKKDQEARERLKLPEYYDL